MDWTNGELTKTGALFGFRRVRRFFTARLFAALGDFATGVEYMLLFVAIVFAIIELLALLIGTRLTRTVTGAVAQLYDATTHINRGDFSHRISVKSNDQLATLANSFNSMTASIENLIEEQKEKQRLQNELTSPRKCRPNFFRSIFPNWLRWRFTASAVPREPSAATTTISSRWIPKAHSCGRRCQREGDFRRASDGYHSLGRSRLQHGRHSQPALAGGGGRDRGFQSGAGSAWTARKFPRRDAFTAQSPALPEHAGGKIRDACSWASTMAPNAQLTYSNGGHLPPIILAEDGSLRGWSAEAPSSACLTTGVMRKVRSLCAGESSSLPTATVSPNQKMILVNSANSG